MRRLHPISAAPITVSPPRRRAYGLGKNPSIAQSGSTLEIKSDQGDISAAKLTSDTTISAGPTFNSIGIVRPDHSIDWSDGTKWRKK
jgi:hypothetical protein